MKITILNKFDIKTYIPEKSSVLIRISSQELRKINELSFEDIIYFYFDDVKEVSEHSMTDVEAKELINFIIKNKDSEEFVVHCDYGQGRSPAVAIFIADIFNIEHEFKIIYQDYNYYVLNKLHENYKLINF